VVKLSLVQLSDSSKDLWNDYVSTNPHASVYHLWEWGDVLNRTYDYRRHYLALQENGNTLGILPLIQIQSFLFGNRLVSLPFCEYGGALLIDYSNKKLIKKSAKMLLGYARELPKKLNMDFIEFRQPSELVSSFLPSFGFTVLRHYVTFRIDLTQSEQVLWKKLEKPTRRHVKKALKVGIEVEDVDAKSLCQYYMLYLKTQKRHGSPPHSYDFFKNIYNVFKSKGLLQMLLATYHGKPIAGRMVFCFNRKLYCWNSVLDRKYASLNASNLLLWHVICWGTENGFKILNLGRTRIEDSGVYNFKKGWGGQRINLEDHAFPFRKMQIPDPLQRRYIFFSKMWSVLPQRLTRKAGPRLIREIAL